MKKSSVKNGAYAVLVWNTYLYRQGFPTTTAHAPFLTNTFIKNQSQNLQKVIKKKIKNSKLKITKGLDKKQKKIKVKNTKGIWKKIKKKQR